MIFAVRLTNSGTVTTTDLDQVADTFRASIQTNIWPKLGTGVSLTTIAVDYMKSTGVSLQTVDTYSLASSGGAPVNDASSCVISQWHIGSYYRGGHPRTYWPLPATADVTNGSTLGATPLSNFATSFNSLRNAVNASTSTNVTKTELGCIRYQSADTWLSPPVFWPYLSVSVRPIIGTQRRRLG